MRLTVVGREVVTSCVVIVTTDKILLQVNRYQMNDINIIRKL